MPSCLCVDRCVGEWVPGNSSWTIIAGVVDGQACTAQGPAQPQREREAAFFSKCMRFALRGQALRV